MRGSSRNIHTRYHAMEAAGYFDSNPANSTARDSEGLSIYTGPVEFPKMLYHPKGLTRVLVPGEIVLSPAGREVKVSEQREIVWQLVRTREEEELLLDEGWHRTPADSIEAGGGEAPPKSPAQLLDAKDTEIERLRRQLEAMQQVQALQARPESPPTETDPGSKPKRSALGQPAL